MPMWESNYVNCTPSILVPKHLSFHKIIHCFKVSCFEKTMLWDFFSLSLWLETGKAATELDDADDEEQASAQGILYRWRNSSHRLLLIKQIVTIIDISTMLLTQHPLKPAGSMPSGAHSRVRRCRVGLCGDLHTNPSPEKFHRAHVYICFNYKVVASAWACGAILAH